MSGLSALGKSNGIEVMRGWYRDDSTDHRFHRISWELRLGLGIRGTWLICGHNSLLVIIYTLCIFCGSVPGLLLRVGPLQRTAGRGNIIKDQRDYWHPYTEAGRKNVCKGRATEFERLREREKWGRDRGTRERWSRKRERWSRKREMGREKERWSRERDG